MSQIKRIAYAFGADIIILMGAVIYYRAGKPLIEMATEDFQGPFSPAAEALHVVPPVVLALLFLIIQLWLFTGGVQEERARAMRRGF